MKMTRIISNTGLFMAVIGMSGMDSESLIIPVVMIIAGLMIFAVGLREDGGFDV